LWKRHARKRARRTTSEEVTVPTWGWVLIAVVAVAVIAVIAWGSTKQRRTRQLKSQFGPEYDRTVESAENKGEAESELAARKERREQIQVRPLSSTARERYISQWHSVQAQFVDSPKAAVASADQLIQSVMADRGYPVDDFETRAADISVDHPQVVENYRQGHRLAEHSADGDGSTENLRQAMRHYRALFDELLESDADEPMTRGRDDRAVSERGAASKNARERR
jgi:FtsZ-interacting cell division protein ZipA